MSVQPFVKPTSELDRRTLGKYELLCRLSTGGMSEIFLATQKGLAGFRKIVVLKSILPDISGEDEFVIGCFIDVDGRCPSLCGGRCSEDVSQHLVQLQAVEFR